MAVEASVFILCRQDKDAEQVNFSNCLIAYLFLLDYAFVQEVLAMANEEKKDFNAMLNDNKDMPKFQVITDEKSIKKYGGSRMYFAPPIDYDKVMRLVP